MKAVRRILQKENVALLFIAVRDDKLLFKIFIIQKFNYFNAIINLPS